MRSVHILNNYCNMNISRSDRPALILVDIQKAFDDIEYWGGQRNNPDAEKNAGELLKLWRRHELPVFHVQHCSSNPGSLLHESKEGNEFKDLVKPIDNEPIIKKNVNSAFIGTSLEAQRPQSQYIPDASQSSPLPASAGRLLDRFPAAR